MGRIIDQSDLEAPVGGINILTELADLNEDGVADTEVVDQAIEEGESEVESFLSPLYHVPVSNPPTILKRYTADVVRWRLGSGRGIGNLDMYQKNYDIAISRLTAIRDGKMRLNIATKPTGSPSVTMGGIVEPAAHGDGGPYWDETWREEGMDEDQVDDGLP